MATSHKVRCNCLPTVWVHVYKAKKKKKAKWATVIEVTMEVTFEGKQWEHEGASGVLIVFCFFTDVVVTQMGWFPRNSLIYTTVVRICFSMCVALQFFKLLWQSACINTIKCHVTIFTEVIFPMCTNLEISSRHLKGTFLKII